MSSTYTFNSNWQQQVSVEREIFGVIDISEPEGMFDQPKLKELISTAPDRVSKIKRKTIEHPSLNKILKKNGNMPKFIVGNFHKYMHEYCEEYEDIQDYQSIRREIEEWLKRRIDLNMVHMQILFGGASHRNYQNCKVLRRIISDYGVDMISAKTKVGNSLSYLVCLQKYTSRLMNPELIGRIQSR